MDKRMLSYPILAAVLAAAVGCSDDESNPTTPDAGSGTAELRVVHASPDAPAVDIYAVGDDTPLVTDLAYGESSDTLEVPAGTYDIAIRAAGAEPSSDPVYTTGDLELADGDKVTAVAAGLLAGSGDNAFRVLALAERFDAPAAGNAIVRIVHASADAPTVAVDVGNDGSPEIASLARFADTGAAGVELPAGTALQIGVWAGDPLARVTAFTTPELPDGGELFVIATGLVGSRASAADGFGLLAVASDGVVGLIQQNPVVYALHGSPDAPAVDIYAGTGLLTENLSFGNLSAPIQVPPDTYTLDFYATGTGPGTPVVSQDTPALAAGQSYLAVATGFLAPSTGQEAFQLVALADTLVEDAANTRLGVAHASSDAPAVDVGTVTTGTTMDMPVLVSNLAFGESTPGDGLSVPPASLTIGVAATGNANAVATFDVTTAAGLRTYAVAAGALAPSLGQEAFRLLLVITSTSPWSVAEILPN